MIANDSLIPTRRAAVDASKTGATAQTTLAITAARAILAACDTPAFTANFSIAGATSENLQYVLEQLHNAGFDTSISSTTLTVTWAA